MRKPADKVIAREAERCARSYRPFPDKSFERQVERDHAVSAAVLDHRVYLRRVPGGYVVRAGNRVDEEFACGELLFSRHEVCEHDAADDLLAELAGVDKVAAVVLVG